MFSNTRARSRTASAAAGHDEDDEDEDDEDDTGYNVSGKPKPGAGVGAGAGGGKGAAGKVAQKKRKMNDAGYAWEASYNRSWDAVQEDEQGGLQKAVEGLLARGRRRR